MFGKNGTARQEILCILISQPLDGAPAVLSGEQESHKQTGALFLRWAHFPPFKTEVNKIFEVQATHTAFAVMPCEKI